MAIKKAKLFKGQSAEYWAIVKKTWDKISDTTSCTLALYFNRQSRLADVKNILESKEFTFEGELTTVQLYLAIKQPVLDEEGVNINWFSDVEDEL